MKKILACATVFIAVASAVLGFQGRLVGKDGKALIGARVQVLGGRGTATVDATGAFRLEPTPPLPFELLVTGADGVVGKPIRVETLPAGEPLQLTIDSAASETVTVLGAVPDIELPPAAAFTVSGRGDLDQRNPAHLAEAMEMIPGAGHIEEGQSAVPTLRGLGRARTLIVLDEGRVTAERRAGPSATFLDPGSIDELEVVRGPGSVAYGSDAFGGVIRARTHIPAPGEPFSLRYAMTGVDNASGRNVNVEAGTPLAGGGLMLGATYRKAGDYASPEGDVFNSGFESRGFRAGYQHELAGGILRALWRSDFGRDIGKPGTDSRVTRAFYPEENSHRLSLSFERGPIGGWSRLAVATSWDQYELITDKYRYQTSSQAARLQRANVFAHDYGLRVEAERPLGPARLVVGLDANGRFGLRALNWTTTYNVVAPPTTEELSVDNARRDDQGVFAALDAGFGKIDVGAGVRLDRVASTNRGGYFGDRDSTHSDASGYLAGTFHLTREFEAVVQVSRGFRDALLSDRYYRGISGRGFITGNPDLNPEHSTQYDLALRHQGGDLTLAAYGYLYRINDLIERYQSGSDFFFRNRGKAEVKGAELEASLRLPAGMLAQLALQAQRGEVLDDGKPIDDVPAYGAVLTVRRNPAERWWWLARFAAYLRDERPGPVEMVVPGYTVVDAGFGYRVNEALEVQLLGRNLTDRAYFGTADALAVLAPGRTVQLSLRGRI